MSKNWKYGQTDTGLTLPLEVAEGTLAGDVVPVAGGLVGYAITPRFDEETALDIDAPAQGLADGQASVRLLPTQGVISVPVADGSAFSVGDAVYGTQAGTGEVTYADTGAYFVGYVTQVEGNNVFVFLGASEPAAEAGG